MSNAKHVLERMDIRTSSRTGAVQDVRVLIAAQDDQITAAVKFINSVITVPNVTFEDTHIARLTAMAIAEAAVKADEIDDVLVYAEALHRATTLRNDPNYAFMFVNAAADDVDGVSVRRGETLKNVAGINVIVKYNGKIKKGGKQVLAAELYKKHILEAKPAMTNQEFIAILVKELGMSKSGATTYAYNCKKQFGEPSGGIVKAKKGRKAKKARKAT